MCQEDGGVMRVLFTGYEHGNGNARVLDCWSGKIVDGKGGHMGGGADWTIIMGQVVSGVMMVGDCRISDQKNEKYDQSQRKFLMSYFACHRVNFIQQPGFVNSLFGSRTNCLSI